MGGTIYRQDQCHHSRIRGCMLDSFRGRNCKEPTLRSRSTRWTPRGYAHGTWAGSPHDGLNPVTCLIPLTPYLIYTLMLTVEKLGGFALLCTKVFFFIIINE